MNAFDTDVFTNIFYEDVVATTMMGTMDVESLYLPIVVIEEVIRGRFSAIRRAEASKSSAALCQAYLNLQRSLELTTRFKTLPYTEEAEALFLTWRQAKIRIGTPDLRIAAIAQAHNAELITRNARDYQQILNLNFTVWA